MCDKTLETKDKSLDQMSERLNDLSLCHTDDDNVLADLGEGTSGQSYTYGRQTSDMDYAVDSMDRFGDDLVELILSYLPFSDKVSLESVSKQWRRVVYSKQTVLHLNRSETEEQNTLNKLLKDIEVRDYSTGFAHYSGFKAIDLPSLKTILKKCPLLSQFVFQCFVDGQVLELIGKHCQYLKSLESNPFGLNEKSLVEFGHKYGHKLQTIRFNDSNYCSVFLKKFLHFCPNVKEVYSEENSAFISEDQMFLPKLETIKTIDIRSEQLNQLKILSDKYWKTMRAIKIYTYHMIGHQLKNAITHISQFESLQSLGLSISIFDEDLQTIDENICEIGKNCSQLKKFNFNINNESVISHRFFWSFAKFYSIEKLSLEFFEVTKKLEGTVECFKQCSQLKHLVISYKELSEEFFANISTVLPNIEIIDIDSDKQMTDSFMQSLSGLKFLKKVILKHSANAHKDMTDTSICKVLTACPKLESIVFSSRPNISHLTIETLIDMALKRPRTNINFSCGFSSAGDEAQFAAIDMDSYAQKIPANLKISIDLGHDLGQALEQNE